VVALATKKFGAGVQTCYPPLFVKNGTALSNEYEPMILKYKDIPFCPNWREDQFSLLFIADSEQSNTSVG
jgi:hypothetical protein